MMVFFGNPQVACFFTEKIASFKAVENITPIATELLVYQQRSLIFTFQPLHLQAFAVVRRSPLQPTLL